MIKLLVRRFVADYENTNNNTVRERYGVLGGVLGIICNTFLFALKLIIGAAAGSIAIISDSFNNLSDCGSSLVSLLGAKLANRRPDSDHPFGHGRYEYVSALIVSFFTMLLGFELLRSGVEEIIHPSETKFDAVMFAILALSVLIKVWMYSYNMYLSRAIGSSVLEATAKDSISDVIATSAIILTTAAGNFVNFPPLDGIVGTVVSLLIIKTGYGVAADTIGLLLGKPPAPETVKKIKDTVLSGEGIVGVHDLIVHDYGPGRAMGSVHAEVPDDSDIVRMHEIIDALENQISHELGIHMVIHTDPVAVNSESVNIIKTHVLEVLRGIDERLNIHDFRMTDGEARLNLIFDLEVPAGMTDDNKAFAAKAANALRAADARYYAVINVDTVYE